MRCFMGLPRIYGFDFKAGNADLTKYPYNNLPIYLQVNRDMHFILTNIQEIGGYIL